MSLLLSLPIELLEQILQNCSKPSLLNLRLVSKSLQRICTPFAFRSLSLNEPWHNTRSSERMKNLLGSGSSKEGLATHIREVSIDRRVLTWPQVRRGMQGQLDTVTHTLTTDFRRLFGACGANLQVLTIGAASDGYRVSRTGEELLIQLGAAFESAQMGSLRKLRAFVETACDLNYLLGRELHDHYDDEEEEVNAGAGDSRSEVLNHPLSSLKELEVYYNAILGQPRAGCDLAPAMRKFSGGLKPLRSLRVEAAYRMSLPTPTGFFPPHASMFDFSSVGSQLTSLHLRGYVYILNTSPIISFLSCLPNLSYLGLCYFTISEMGYRGDPTWPSPSSDDVRASGLTGVPNWKDVFEQVHSGTRNLVRYEFVKLVNLVVETDAGPKNIEGDDKYGYDGMTVEETAALERLRGEVARRRIASGMSDDW